MIKLCACGSKRLPTGKLCYRCWQKEQKVKRDKKKARETHIRQVLKIKERKKIRIEKRQKSLPVLKKIAWKLVSEYVRRCGADSNGMQTCFTCGCRKHWKEMHAGHLFHGRLDYSLLNLKPQCARCNIFLNGNGAVYAMKMTELLGIDGMKALLLDANTRVYSYEDIKQVIVVFTEKLKELELTI
jgi:hypothetical protein